MNPSFAKFYEAPSLPLVDLPPMAGLVEWDHSVQYTTPSMSDFSSGAAGGSQVTVYLQLLFPLRPGPGAVFYRGSQC